jgi:hypothetical protein
MIGLHGCVTAVAVAACFAAGRPAVAAAQGQTPTPSREADCAKSSDTSANHRNMGNMDHAAHQAMMHDCAGGVPVSPGQAAFGAISEVVRMLEADPGTDWSRVNIEALRQHLIDMDHVTMQSAVAQRSVAGGIQMDVTGAGRTTSAIRRMAVSHAAMLGQSAEYQVTATEIRGGARIIITATKATR